MTREEFQKEFQGRFLLFLTEAWAVRHKDSRELGMYIDRHGLALRELLRDVYDALKPEPKAATGAAQPARSKT